MTELWKQYEVELQVSKIGGGIPRHPEMVKRWQEARGGNEEQIAASVESLGTQALDDTEDVKALWTGFCSDEKGLYIEDRNVKAMIKESANIVKEVVGVKALKSKVAERVFVKPKRIYLGKMEPDGMHEKPIHVMTRQGPRTALKRLDYCKDVKVSFGLKVVADKVVTEGVLRVIFEHGSENGLGSDRSQGFGTFEILRFEAVGE